MNDKEERIEQLEKQVEKLSNAVSMPTRRETLAAGGLLGAGALLGGGVGDAEAATVGQVGTDTDRVNVFGASGDFNLVSTEGLTNADFDRPVWSTESRTISVPGDVSVDDLWKEIPCFINHEYIVKFDDGTYGDIYLPPSVLSWRTADTNGSERAPLTIRGNQTTPSNVSIKSIFADSIVGHRLDINALEITGSNPWDNESVGIAAYGCTEVSLVDLVFGGGTNGVLSYNSTVRLNGVDFGATVLSGDGITTKHSGVAWEAKLASTPTEGNVGAYAYTPGTGEIMMQGHSSTLTGNSGLVGSSAEYAGRVYDPERGIWHDGKWWWEVGRVNHADPGVATDGTWDTSTFDAASVTFDAPFSWTPRVYLQAESPLGKADPDSLSASGFDSVWKVFSSSNSAATDVSWLAVGE